MERANPSPASEGLVSERSEEGFVFLALLLNQADGS